MVSWFSLPVDPKAGEWKHEVFLRFLLALLFCNLRECLQYCLQSWPITNTLEFCLLILLLAVLAACEGIIRRSWVIFLLFLILLIAANLSDNLVIQTKTLSESLKNALIYFFLGAIWGAVAGFGSRNSKATLLGILVGGLGGSAIGYCEWELYEIAVVTKAELQELYYYSWEVFRFGKFALLASIIGFAVWAGVKFSKRTSKPPTA